MASEVLYDGCPRPFRGRLLSGVLIMKKTKQPQREEPVGIVISRGRDLESPPRFSAYVWAPGPDDELERDTQPA